MKRCLGMTLVVAVALGSACVDIPEPQPAPGGVLAIFDPVGDEEKKIPIVIPIPTDLVKDPATGLLAAIPDRETDSKGQKAFNAYLRTLNGYPTSATAEVKFSGKLDPAYKKALPTDAFLVYNVTDKKAVTGLVFDYKEIANKAEGSESLIRIFNFAGWERGKEYAFFVYSGSKGLKDAGGKPLIRSALFELAFAPNPLCAWDQTRSWDSTKGACLQPASGKKAMGCCTFNYSGLLDSTVSKKVIKASHLEGDELEAVVKSAVLENASKFEAIRLNYDRMVKASGVKRDDVVIAWSFSTLSMNVAQFNPSVSPAVLPKPTDLVRNPATGFLAVPLPTGASKAELEFNDYLSSLDGWHTGYTVNLLFTQALDEKSVGTTTYPIKLYKVAKGTSGVTLTQVAEDKVKVAFDPKTNGLNLTPSMGLLELGTTYMAVALAGTTGLKNKDTTLTAAPKRDALMELVLGTEPLCDWDSAKKVCKDAQISSFVDDPAVVPGGRTGVGKATIFEGVRQGLDPLVKALISDGKIKRDDVIAAWTYTTTTLTEFIYDTTSGVIPFPNNVLIDQTSGKLAIPVGALPESLRKGLNQLNGFSTQGEAYAPYVGTIDKTTVAYGTSMLALDLDLKIPISMNFSLDEKSGAIIATPVAPLKEGTMYGIVMISRLDKGKLVPKAGLKDSKGNRPIPALFMALKRNRHPLFDTKTQKSLVSVLDDATAELAESARLGHVPFFDALVGLTIEREDVVAAWTFKTQTFEKGVTDLRTKALAALPAAPTLTGALLPAGIPATVPQDGIGGWVPSGTFKTWNALDTTTGLLLADVTKGKTADVPYVLTVPKTAAPAAGWPVVVFQHGLRRHRLDLLAVANTLAKAGIATIGFDVIYHGARSWCTKDDQCSGTGTCTTTTGKCSTTLDDADKDGVVDASGALFLNADNPFAIRDNMLQHVVDASALLRTIDKGGASGITGGTVTLDKAKIYYVGQNVGSNLGVLTMANDPLISRAVFNTGGAPLVDVLLVSSGTKTLIDDVLKQFSVQKDTLGFLQLVYIFHTMLDPSDAGNWGAKLKGDDLLVQVAGKDDVIPASFGEYLGATMGLKASDNTITTFANQGHSFLLKPDPSTTVTATVAAQTQLVKFLMNPTTVCKPDTATGACN
jgi:hypothetical protein